MRNPVKQKFSNFFQDPVGLAWLVDSIFSTLPFLNTMNTNSLQVLGLL